MTIEERHNKYAPFWAAAMVIFGIAGISTTWVESAGFWKEYMLDICGPAWNYILFRGLFTSYKENRWIQFFNPLRTFIIFTVTAFGIEALQFFEVYDSTFDPWDLFAYISLLTPLFILDLKQSK